MSCQTRSGVLTRSTLCFAKRFNAQVRVSLPEPLPLGPSVLQVEIHWTPPAPEGQVKLTFRRLSAAAADVRFGGADGQPSFTFTGDVTGDQGLLRVFGAAPTAGDQADLMLDVTVDDKSADGIPVLVRRDGAVTGEPGLAVLRGEVATAVASARPAAADAQGIWDRYNDIFTQARAFADVLATTALPTATVPPAGGGAGTQRSFNRDALVAALRSNADRSGPAAEAGQGKVTAFDSFQGKWRGPLRRQNDCAAYAGICQDHDRRAIERLVEGGDIYAQPVLASADSRPYPPAPVGACQELPAGRDVDTPAVFAINVTTGVLAAAAGIYAQAGTDGTRGQRLLAGFYLGDGHLLWVAEERRADALSTYSLFEELAEAGADGVPLTTTIGFTFTWDRTQRRLTTPLAAFGGQVRQVLTPEEAALARDFAEHRLRLAHLQDMRYRRRLESLDPATVGHFQASATDETRGYLERLLDFVRQQQALAAAPTGPRTSITFIMGEDPPGTPNLFYTGATAFFTLNPAGRLVTDLRTLQAVRNFLDNNRPANGAPWGEVNIVVHANEEGGMSIPAAPLAPGEDPAFHQASPATLQAAVASGALQPLADDVVDVRTVLNIRGCALGRSPDMLHALSTTFGGDETQRPVVRAPKHLQAFEFFPGGWRTTDTNPPTGAELYFIEFWFVAYPHDHRPNNATLIAQFNASFPGVGVNWAAGLRTVGPPNGDQLANETRDRTYHFTLTTRYVPIPANNGALAAALAQQGGDFTGLSNVQETSRAPAAGGRTRINFSAVRNGNPFQGFFDFGPNPPLPARPATNDSAGLALLAAEPAVVADLARLGNAIADYDWSFTQNDANVGNGEREWTVEATGRRTILRIERELREPDPARPGRTRRAHPPVTDLTHFGEEVPARPAAPTRQARM